MFAVFGPRLLQPQRWRDVWHAQRKCMSSRFNSFQDEKLVLKYAKQNIRPITLCELMSYGRRPLTESQVLASCEYSQNELPVRLAKRVLAFQRLPFIVGMNPYISRVYHQYYDAFERLREFPPVKDLGAEAQFTNALLRQTQLLSDVIPTIAQGFHECKKYMDEKDTTEFLNDLITARIGMRVIGEQHVELSHQYREALRDPGAERGEGEVETARRQDTLSDWVGSINISLEPAKMIKQICMYAQNICELHYGTAPEFIIDGVVDTSMTYIPSHLEYIIMEIVKNAFRATIEYSTKTRRLIHPPVRITVSKGVKYVGIRVRDEGGGIPKADMPHVFDYSWTSMKEKAAGGTDAAGDSSSVFSIQANLDMQSGTGGPIAGLGFGLPMAKLYCQYFGGSLEIASMEGLGCDVFIKLPCLELNLNRTII